MQNYRRILAAVDLDTASNQVCQRALSLAHCCGADVVLLHVLDPVALADPMPVAPLAAPGVIGATPATAAPNEEAYQVAREQAQEKIEQLAATLGDVAGERRVVTASSTHDAIQDCAREAEADLIVVGSHGRHGLALFFTGSTAKEVLKDAPCDVLAVRIEEAL